MNTSLDRNEAAALETGEINTGNFLRTFPKEKRGDQIKTSYKKIKDPDNGNVALNKPIAGYSSTPDVPSRTSHNTFLNDGDYTTAWRQRD